MCVDSITLRQFHFNLFGFNNWGTVDLKILFYAIFRLALHILASVYIQAYRKRVVSMEPKRVNQIEFQRNFAKSFTAVLLLSLPQFILDEILSCGFLKIPTTAQ